MWESCELSRAFFSSSEFPPLSAWGRYYLHSHSGRNQEGARFSNSLEATHREHCQVTLSLLGGKALGVSEPLGPRPPLLGQHPLGRRWQRRWAACPAVARADPGGGPLARPVVPSTFCSLTLMGVATTTLGPPTVKGSGWLNDGFKTIVAI